MALTSPEFKILGAVVCSHYSQESMFFEVTRNSALADTEPQVPVERKG